MKAQLAPFTKERYEEIKARAEASGRQIVTRWRPGLKSIRFADIVLGERLT